ncbi:MAG: DUF4345 domain-containing protein [Rhodobiaceae bacterium]|nr:DUF4345 domain-containing protein [Rhodobiaceae bacterium]
MMKLILRANLFVLGVAAIGIGLSMLFLGSDATGQFFAAIINSFLSDPQELNGLSSPNVDSELRFYSVFWVAYGIIVLRAANSLDENFRLVPILAGLFFAGGAGRLLSAMAVGQPHPLFTVLMMAELVLPLLLIALWVGINRLR